MHLPRQVRDKHSPRGNAEGGNVSSARRWDDGRAYPATIVSMAHQGAVIVSWKDESDADRCVSVDDVTMDSRTGSGQGCATQRRC